MDDDITNLGHMLTIATGEMYGNVIEKFGKKMTDKFMSGATQEKKESFVQSLKKAQTAALHDRLSLIMNRILTDYKFIKEHDQLMEPFKTTEELREDNEIANNHLQSVENERSILQRDTDMAIDKLESVIEAILNQS